jgi:hypothetical protein
VTDLPPFPHLQLVGRNRDGSAIYGPKYAARAGAQERPRYVYRLFNERVQGDAYIREKYGIRGDWKTAFRAEWIRQKISFHYVDEDRLFESSFEVLSDTEAWELYLADTTANTFHYASNWW